MTDGVIGSVGVSVVPDAQAFWDRFRAQTEGGAGEAGRRAGQDWQRGFDEATRSTTIRVRADTSQARAQVAALNKEVGSQYSSSAFSGLINTAVTLGPALIPIAAAAATAGAELAAMGAAGILAVKGIEAEMKAGTPIGQQYSQLVKLLKTNLGELEATASHGVLDGVLTSVGKAQQALPQLNDVIATQSRLLGSVTSHLVGGLVGGFSTFAPVLAQIGESADRVAARFEGWATGPGGAKFAHVLSEDYAKVAPIIGDIVGAVGHLVAASNGTGLLIVSEIGVLARVLDSFPTPVLTGMVDAFIGFRVVSGITAAVIGLSNAFPILATRAAASAAVQTAANLGIQASEAATAAATATAQADQATAHAAVTARIAESAAAQNSVLAGAAAATATAAAEEATAFQLAATEAQAAAARIAGAAEAAAAASAEAGAAASIGWSAMLGPAGIAVAAIAVLGLGFLNSGKNASSAAADIQTLTQAIESDAGAIGKHTRASVVDALGSSGALAAARELHIGLSSVTDAAVGTGNAYETLRAKLEAQKQANADAYHAGKLSGDELDRRYNLIQKLEDALSGETGKVKDASQAAKDHAAALAATKQAESGMAGAVLASTQQLSDGNTAIRGYVDALAAFDKSADTAADRGKLIGSVLAAANGDALAYAGSIVAAVSAQSALGDAFVADRQKVSDLRAQIAQLTNVTGPSATANGVLAAQINKTGTTMATTKDRISQLQNQIDSGKLSASALAGAHRALQNAQASLQVSSANLANQQSKLSAAQGGGTVNVVQLTKLQRELAQALKDSEAGAITFTKHGKELSAAIDYTAKGAGPLISQLQAIQDSSEKAAAAVYQHEVATRGGKVAADDAYNFYVSHTSGALEEERKKLHLTAGQAKALGDEYFGIKNSADIKKKIELVGEDKVVNALKGILQDLDILIGKTTVLDLAIAKANATAPKNIGRPGIDRPLAAGGYVAGPGPKGVDSVHILGAPGEFMMSDKAVDRFGLSFMQAINAGVMPTTAARADTTPPQSGALAVTNKRSVTQVNNYHYPLQERALASPTAARAAQSKLGRLGG